MLHLIGRRHPLLLNPLWYVMVIAALAGVTFYFRAIWWLAGLVALLWGMWLVWQVRRDSGSTVVNHGQLCDQLELARTYGDRIDQLLKAYLRRHDRPRQQQLRAKVSGWIGTIEQVIKRLDDLYRDELIRYDMMAVPRAIEDLKTGLRAESNVTIRTQMERTLVSRRRQAASLNQLYAAVRHAEINVEQTLALLGTVYSQILVTETSDQVADYERLCLDVDEEVSRLEDHLAALWEVKGLLI